MYFIISYLLSIYSNETGSLRKHTYSYPSYKKIFNETGAAFHFFLAGCPDVCGVSHKDTRASFTRAIRKQGYSRLRATMVNLRNRHRCFPHLKLCLALNPASSFVYSKLYPPLSCYHDSNST